MHRPCVMRSIVKTVRSGADASRRGRNREQREADEDAEPAVDMRAEEADDETGDRHAHGAWH